MAKKTADKYLRVSDTAHAALAAAHAAAIGRRGRAMSLRAFTEEVLTAGIKQLGKSKKKTR